MNPGKENQAEMNSGDVSSEKNNTAAMNPEEMKKMRKIRIKMNILMGVSMSFILSLVGSLSGGHFALPSWILSFAISAVLALLIGFVVPIKKLCDGFCKKCNANPQSIKGNLLGALVSNIIYTPVLTIVMVSIMVSIAAAHAPAGAAPSIGQVLPGSLIICLIAGYICIIVLQPLFLKLLLKK